MESKVATLANDFRDFRAELRADITRLETAIRDGDEETRRSLEAAIREGDEETRRQMRVLHEEVIVLTAAVHHGDEETRNQMRVLHEDVIERIARIGEGRPRRKK